MRLLAEELNALGVQTRYDGFEDSWIDPAEARLAVGQTVIGVEPAIPLGHCQAGFYKGLGT